jgi:hypothetical protein
MSSDPSRDIRTGGGMYNESGQVYNSYGNQRYGPEIHGNNVHTGGVYAGRDYHHIEDDRPYYHTLRPLGRVLVALGSVSALAGFAMFGYLAIGAIGEVVAQKDNGVVVPELHFDMTWLAPGATLFFAGIVLISVGSAVGRRVRAR